MSNTRRGFFKRVAGLFAAGAMVKIEPKALPPIKAKDYERVFSKNSIKRNNDVMSITGHYITEHYTSGIYFVSGVHVIPMVKEALNRES